MALDADEYPESISKFESMLKTNEVYFFDAEDFEDIIHHYLNNGKVTLGKKALQIGLEQHPNTLELKLLEVEILIFEEHYAPAESLLDELETLDANNEEIYIQRANLQSRKNNHQGAIALLLKALELTDDYFYLHTLLGMEHLFVEQYKEAKQNFIKCLELDESDYSSLYNLVYCFELLEDHEGAVRFLDEYLERNPYCEVAWHQLGNLYYTTERYEEAIAALDFAIISDDTFTGAYFDKGKVLEKLGKYEEAIKNYETTLTLEDPSPHAYLRIGKCYEKLGNHDLAKTHYYNTVQEDPLLDKGWLAITDFHCQLQEYHEALYHIKRALYLDGENPAYWKKAAKIHIALNHWEEAEQAYKKTVSLGNHETDSWIQWAELLETTGNPRASLEVLIQGLEFHPEDIELLYKLARLYLKNEEATLAEKQMLKIVEVALKKLQRFENKLPEFDALGWLQKLITELKKNDR